MRHLPLSHLRSLAAVRAEGGVRSAAKRLAVEHSTVSRALHELEKWMGVPIILARTRGQAIQLTKTGEALGDAALNALRDLELATDKLREAKSSKRVVIATPPSVANRWLLPRLTRIEEDCGGVELSIIVDAIRMGDLDPHADLSLRMGSYEVSGALIDVIGSDVAFPVVARQEWEQCGHPRDVTALSHLPLLHDRDMCTAWSTWRDAFGPANLDVMKGPRFTSGDLLLRAAEQGRGFALDLSRICTAPLTWYFATKETVHGITTRRGVSRRSSPDYADQRFVA